MAVSEFEYVSMVNASSIAPRSSGVQSLRCESVPIRGAGSTYGAGARSASGSTFGALMQNLLASTMVTCPKCGESFSLANMQVGRTGSSLASLLNSSSTSGVGNLDATLSGANDLAGMNIEWPRGQDVSDWDQTVTISNVRVANGRISWSEMGDRDTWPIGGEGNCNANAWIIRKQADGSYKAETWEYVRKGQTCKLTDNIEELDDPPRSGERVGIMLAGITRNPRMRNIEARSNVAWITWP